MRSQTKEAVRLLTHIIAYHSDGYNIPIMQDLIEIGLDVLNPIQVESMNPEDLKRDFGDKLSFFGGIDVQDRCGLL